MIKAIIFDFFGVLVGDGFDTTYRYAGGNPDEDKNFIERLLEQANRGSLSVEDFRSRICEHLNISVNDYQKAIAQAEQVNRELLEYIDGLHKTYKTAVLSNVNKGGLERRIDRETLDRYFDELIVSGEVGYIKPESEIYKLAANKLGVEPSECVFIDDRSGYVEAAEKLGMKGIVYKDFAAFKEELEELIPAVADN